MLDSATRAAWEHWPGTAMGGKRICRRWPRASRASPSWKNAACGSSKRRPRRGRRAAGRWSRPGLRRLRRGRDRWDRGREAPCRSDTASRRRSRRVFVSP